MTGVKIVVAHVVLSLKPGGLENGVVNIINGLNTDRFLSKVYCLQEKGDFAERIASSSVEFREYGLKPGNDFSLPGKLAQDFKNDLVDVVHTRNPEAFFYGAIAARIAGIKGVLHSEHGRDFPDRWHRTMLQRWLTRKVPNVVTMSEDLRRDIVRYVGIPEEKISVIYNGVDNRFLQPYDIDSCKGSLALPGPPATVVGTIGRLAEVKNQALLVDAVSALQKEGRNISLVIVGDGPLRADLERRAQENLSKGSYLFYGFRTDILPFLRAMDIFVLPSRNEGISNTLLEAMACEKPVIACEVGGNTEIVQNGVDGLLVPNNDNASLANAIRGILDNSDTASRLARTARRRILERHSMTSMVQQYERFYSNLAGRQYGTDR